MAFDLKNFKDVENSYSFSLTNKSTLEFSQMASYPAARGKFDFAIGVLYIGYKTEAGVSVTPFSQLDPDVVAAMRDKLIELGGKPPIVPDHDSEEWARIGNTGIAQTTTCPEINHKLTNVFNFVSRQMVTLTENLSTRAESSATPVSFDELPDSVLTEALTKFAEMGGKTDETFVLKGKSSLPKNKLG